MPNWLKLDFDLPPPEADENLDLDKMVAEHLEQKRMGDSTESTLGIRLADIMHAVELERGNIKDNKKAKKKNGKAAKAPKRATQPPLPTSKAPAKKPRQRGQLRHFPPLLNQ